MHTDASVSAAQLDGWRPHTVRAARDVRRVWVGAVAWTVIPIVEQRVVRRRASFKKYRQHVFPILHGCNQIVKSARAYPSIIAAVCLAQYAHNHAVFRYRHIRKRQPSGKDIQCRH